MRDARTWIARLGIAGLCLLGTGCGGGGVPDPGSDPTATVDAPPPQVSGVMPSTVNSAPAPSAAPAAAPAAPQVAQGEPAPVATPAPAVVATPAPAPAEPVAIAATSPAPSDGTAPAAEEKPQPAAKGDASATNELLNLSSSTTNAAPAAEAAKGEVPVASVPGAAGGVPGAGGAMAGGGTAYGPGNIPGPNRGGPDGSGGPGGMPGDSNASNQPASYSTPMAGAATFLNAVKSKNKDRIADATARHAQAEAHSAALQKLFAQILDLSVSDEQIDELAKALNGYTLQSLDMATSTGRQKVVLGKSNGSNGQFRRTLTMRHEAKGWKVLDISGQSEIQGFGMPGLRKRTNSR